MALFTKEDKNVRPAVEMKPPTDPSVNAPRPMKPKAEVNAHLGQGATIEGKLTFKGSVQIDGRVEGEIIAEDTVVLGESAVVIAKITAAKVIAQGRVEGDIEASQRLELRAPASVKGNLRTPSLVIHEGVTFEGRSDMGGKESASSTPESGDKRVAIFPTEDRGNGNRRKSEAAN